MGREASVLCSSQVRALRIAPSSCWAISLPPGASKHTAAVFFLQLSPAWLHFMPCPGEAPHSVAISPLNHVLMEETPIPTRVPQSSSRAPAHDFGSPPGGAEPDIAGLAGTHLMTQFPGPYTGKSAHGDLGDPPAPPRPCTWGLLELPLGAS